MELVPGAKLGPYQIQLRLGAGGMGEVYRAIDSRLGREVALKVLPPELAKDPEHLTRFRREAKTLAQIDHPNIVTIYSVEEFDGVHFLTMQLVQGQTLSSLIPSRGLPLERIVAIASELTDALAAAHEKGIMHRDLKPSNIMLTSTGHVKVLDFGLAKDVRAPASDDATRTSSSDTQTGMVMGTPAYMSPEQLSGRPLDQRTDIFSFGIVLHEMVTGVRPFSRRSRAELISAILRDDPPAVTRLRPELPPDLERILRRCLQKDPGHRIQTARDISNELRDLVRQTDLSAHSRHLSQQGSTARTASIQSIAVLPLENLSRDPSQEYFVDGMTEALITDLAKISALRVISRTSAMRYKGISKPLPEIGKELGVDAIVEGSVLRAGEQIRITAQLIDAGSDIHLWAESYSREFKDILSLQSEVAQAIAREVRARVMPDEAARLKAHRTVKPSAHEAYLLGRHFWNQRGSGLKKSVEYFERALREDSSYAPAYAGLADAYALLGFYAYLPPREIMPKAKEAARTALDLDSQLAEAHTSLGFVHTVFDWDWAAAESEFHAALKLNPSWGPARYWYATYFLSQGRMDEATAQVRKGLEYDPLSMYMHVHLAIVLWYAGRLDAAAEPARHALELDANFLVARSFLGAILCSQGRQAEGFKELGVAVNSSDRDQLSLSMMAVAYAQFGDRAKAAEIIAELEARRGREYISAMNIAIIYAQLKEKENAFRWLEEAYQERSSMLWALQYHPQGVFENLRDDPRAADLLRRIGASQ
jgi:serine/threonine-protein kinase